MSTIPTPRSFNQILADQIDALRSKLGVPSLPPGDPILTILEASAQSDLRNSQDIFQMLASVSLDKATGLGLERIGADEDLTKFVESPASGFVTITDSSFDKIQSTVFQGLPAPIVGTSAINVVSALGWPSTGDIYIGRGTTQYEGPISYTSLTDNGGYWTINLSSATQKYHNHGEAVILAQGGDRLINANVVVQTPQGNAGDSVQFATLYASTIPDGETEIANVTVVAKTPGIVGNVASNAINSFSSVPFTGATVTNPRPFTNGRAAETDKEFKERIKNARQSKAKATPLALKTAVVGATSTDENKRVLSSNVVIREGFPTTVYIDDGNGYEERSEGVAYETLTASALGGEQYFSLANGRPVAKAFLLSAFSAPYNLTSGDVLAVKVGGTVYEHQFSDDEFRAINNATAYEVVASINGNPEVKFNARTSDNGTKVAVFADDDINEDVEVVAPSDNKPDANDALGIPSGTVDTLRLYKNDRLLTKDGLLATLSSNPQSQWSVMSSGETLQIKIDSVDISGISNTYTFTDSDFVDAGTAYTTLSASNSLDSWVEVINFKIPGITAEVNSGLIKLTSNAGRVAKAKIEILGGSLTTKGMFEIGSSEGAVKDYTLNRNLGQIRLEDSQILEASDRLTAGSLNTRAFLESDALTTVNLTSDAEMWFCVDGDAQIIPTGIAAGTTVTYSLHSAEAWGDRVTVTVGSSIFANVEAGDWLIVNDPVSASDQGAFRVIVADPNFVRIERESAYVATGAVVLSAGGVKVVRSSTQPQRIIIPSGTNYTALTLAQALNNQLVGATASVYKTTKIRIKTNSFDIGGDIALVVSDAQGDKLKFTPADATVNLTSHLASVQAGNNQAGTPVINELSIASVTSGTVVDLSSSAFNPGNFLVATRPTDDGVGRYSQHGHISSCVSLSGVVLTTRTAPLADWLIDDRVYEASAYAINGQDNLVALIDDDVLTKRYDVQMYRRTLPTTAVYGATNYLKDVDNSSLSLAVGFGLDFNWEDFMVYMKSRTKTHLLAGVNTTKTILYRYYRWGPEGDFARLQYRYPSLPDSEVSVESDSLTDDYNNVKVYLPSDAARTGTTIRTSTWVGVAATAVAASLYDYYYVLNMPISSGSRTANVTTITLTLPGPITDHGIVAGNQIYVNSTDINFSSGVKVVTAVTATDISYVETAANQAATPNIGTISRDTVGIATLNGSTVVAGDIMGIVDGTGIDAPFAPIAAKIKTLDVSGGYWQITTDVVGAVGTTLTWYQVEDADKIQFFPIAAANTADDITNAVNAITTSPVSAVAVGGGAGAISAATYETVGDGGEGAADPWYYLSDGYNYIKSYTAPISTALHYLFEFKLAINADLAVDSDWDNEDVRLVPITAQNVVDYLNSTGTSGLSSVAEVVVSSDGQKPQISSLTPGSTGSVQIQGGSANFLASTAKNSATEVGANSIVVSFPTSDLSGLSGFHFVQLQNTKTVPKVGRITSATTLDSLDVNGNFTFSGTDAWEWANAAAAVIQDDYQFIKQGNLVEVRLTSGGVITGTAEGDVAYINATAGTTANNGIFRIIKVGAANDRFWIQNDSCVEGIQACDVAFLTYSSILPGDTISINTSVWSNVGMFTVESIDLDQSFGGTGDVGKFKVQAVTTAVGAPVNLGSNFPLVQVIEGTPTKLIKRISGISPTAGDSSGTDVKFDTQGGSAFVGAFAGTIMQPLDKLGFPTDIAQGIDGYQHNTGLLAEANKVLYGDESDPGSYPGYVAAGAKVNIAGPLVKRIELSLGIRVNTGISVEDVFNRVKSEVAATVNKSDVGSSISISSIIKAAEGVNGVEAVSILSPVYNVANDLIPVQPYEKPLILDVDADVLVSLVGE